MTTNYQSTQNVINVTDARPFTKIGDKILCKLTKVGDYGTYANAIVEKSGQEVSISGLFKDYFGDEYTYVWGQIIRYDSKGKVGFKLCEASLTESEEMTTDALAPHVLAEMETAGTTEVEEKQVLSSSFEDQLEKAKTEMRAEFEMKLKEAESRMKSEMIQQETSHLVQEMAKITGIVSPRASTKLQEMLLKAPSSEVGKALAIVAASHDSSYDFAMKMDNILRGCL